jgi:hypothetical protein
MWVPKSIFDSVDALATNSNARVLAIGNPDDPASHFAQIFTPGSGGHVITVSALDTPACTGEKVPEALRPLLVCPESVEERKIDGRQQSDRPILRDHGAGLLAVSRGERPKPIFEH